jgi:hypothetical protein
MFSRSLHSWIAQISKMLQGSVHLSFSTSQSRPAYSNLDAFALHLVCSDLTCDYDAITTTYKKRWQVEVFHKSLKSNASLAKSPTRTLRTQSNHVSLSICAAFKLECLSLKNKLSPFALCRKLLINAARSAYDELLQLRATA